MKIIFLDIDGPMIPMTSYIFNRNASWQQELDSRSVEILHHIVKKSGAYIVFNSTHSRMLEADLAVNSPGLIQRFKDAGFSNYLHMDICTKYPDIPRLKAIEEWLSRHPEVTRWVALDDAEILDERAFLVNPNYGIGFNEVQHCFYYLNGETKKFVLM